MNANSENKKIVDFYTVLLAQALNLHNGRIRFQTAKLAQDLINAEKALLNEIELDASVIEELNTKNIEFLDAVDIFADEFIEEIRGLAKLVYCKNKQFAEI